MQQLAGAVALHGLAAAPIPAPVIPLRALASGPLSSARDADAERLLRFNRDLLDQALDLVALHDRPHAPSYASHAGAHLRHVIEHYEALLLRPLGEPLAYDNRPRDRELERCTLRARARLLRLQQRLQGWTRATLDTSVRVLSRGGVAGEFEFITMSSLGRELMFLASHAVHHFALLTAYCLEHGLAMRAHFGKASATVAHELHARTTPLHTTSRNTRPID